MRLGNLALVSSALLLFSATSLSHPQLRAQDPAAAPPAAAPATPAPPTAPTVNVYTREVVVDVTVTDPKGNPVHGLTQSDFTVTEQGSPITPRSFREHRSDEPPPAAAEPPGPSLPPNTFTNTGAPETTRPFYLLLIDSLDIPPATQSIVQKAAADFVGKLAPGTRVAVFSLSPLGRLSIVQGFTADQDDLKKAVKSSKISMQIPPLEDFGQDSTNPSSQTFSPPSAGGGMRVGGGSASAPQPPKPQVDADVECAHTSARGLYTFSALSQIARYLSGMPGRKNVIWFTGAFPYSMTNKQKEECVDFRHDLEVVEEMFEHSHVALFPIDPRSLDIMAANSALSYPARLQTNEHLVMNEVAERTGGRALFNTNDLSGAAAQAIISGANYYTIVYSPPNQNWDTRLRSISVTVDKPNLTLDYKHGYHALAPGETLSGRPNQPPATPLQSAMMQGTLQPSELLFNVAVAQAPTPDTALPPGNNADPRMTPPYRRLTLTYAIDANGIQFDPAADGRYHGKFQYAVNVYDAAGQLINSSLMGAAPALPPNIYQSVLHGGAKVRQEIDIPAKGDYTLRIGVHDLTTDRVGAIELSTANVAPDATPPIPSPPPPAP